MTAPASAIEPRPRNPFAVVSIVLVAVLLALTLTTRVLTVFAPAIAQSAHLTSSTIGALFSILGGIGVLLALAAAVLGLIGVTRPGLPHGLAAAGLGIGVTSAVGYVLVSLADLAVAGTAVL